MRLNDKEKHYGKKQLLAIHFFKAILRRFACRAGERLGRGGNVIG